MVWATVYRPQRMRKWADKWTDAFNHSQNGIIIHHPSVDDSSCSNPHVYLSILCPSLSRVVGPKKVYPMEYDNIGTHIPLKLYSMKIPLVSI